MNGIDIHLVVFCRDLKRNLNSRLTNITNSKEEGCNRMTKEEIITLKPGQDLDIKVALTIMDYLWLKHLLQFSAELAVKWLGTPEDLKNSSGMYVPVPDSQFLELKERENFAEAVLPFSSEMGAAQLVIDKMQELGYEYHLEEKSEGGSSRYYAHFTKADSDFSQEKIGFRGVPEAIVKGALVAIKG